MKQIKIQCLDYELAADWYESTGDKVLLVLPGYSSNKKNAASITSHIVELTGMSALVMDYGGHGESPFELRDVTPAQNFLETITVFDWLNKNYRDKKVSVLGTSYGGMMGLQLTKYRQFDRLVLRAPAIYTASEFYSPWSIRIDNPDVYANKEAALRSNPEELAKHPLFARAANFKGKAFVVVHGEDEIVPEETTDMYIKVLSADSYVAKDFPHNFPHDAPRAIQNDYRQAIADFLNAN